MQNATLSLAALTVTSASLFAQGAIYSPKYMASTEGQYYSFHPGNFPAMHYQTVDGENRGKVASLKEIALRLDNRSYNSVTGMGRTWTNVTIQLGDGDIKTFSNNFAANIKSPTRVFSATVTWPTMSGNPLTTPALWGGVTGRYRFPFSTQWTYLGKSDIVSDWTFTGGTLANNYNWLSTLSRSYYLDSYGSPTSTAFGTYKSIPPIRLNNNSPGVTGRCNDSAFGTTTVGAYAYIFANVYGPYYENVDWRNKLVMYSYSYYTAYNAPVIHAWGSQTNVTGVDLGTGCNKLHALGPYVLQTFITLPKSVRPDAYSGYRYIVVPWNQAFANLKVCMQAGWADSATGKFNMSQAREATLPASAPPSQTTERMAIFSYATSAPRGPYAEYIYNPAMRYLY